MSNPRRHQQPVQHLARPTLRLLSLGLLALLWSGCESAEGGRRETLLNFQPVQAQDPALVAGDVPLEGGGEGLDAYSYKVPARDVIWTTDGIEYESQAGLATDAYGRPYPYQQSSEYQVRTPSQFFRVKSNEPVVDRGESKFLGFSVEPERPWVSKDGGTLDVRVRISAPSATAPQQGGTNFAVVFDLSESARANDKLAILREAAEYFIDQVVPGDRVTFVVVNDRVTVPLSLTQNFDKRILRALLERAEPGGEGNLAAALDEAYRDMESVVGETGEPANVILVTDGQAGRGGTGAWRFVNLALQRQAKLGVRLNVVGIGHDMDAGFLAELARVGRGRFTFLHAGTPLREVLDRELRSMLHVHASNVSVSVVNDPDVSVESVLGLDLPRPLEGVDHLALTDFVEGEMRSYIFRLRYPPSRAATAFRTTFKLAFQQVASERSKSIDRPLKVHSVQETKRAGGAPRVAAHRDILNGLEQIRLALESRDTATAQLVVERAESEAAKIRKVSVESADRDLLRSASIYSSFAAKLRVLLSEGKLEGASIEREAALKELHYSRSTAGI